MSTKHAKILVDADACPVKSIIVEVAEKFGLGVVMFIDTSHILRDGYAEIVVVDKARDSVDIALINRTQQGDIVVTQDYGVAAMALSKKAFAINNNGFEYNSDNIDRLLFERHLSQKIRRAGGKTSGARRRNREDDERFREAFKNLCSKAQ